MKPKTNYNDDNDSSLRENYLIGRIENVLIFLRTRAQFII